MPVWEADEFSVRKWPDWSFGWGDGAGRPSVTRTRVTTLVANAAALAGLAPLVGEVTTNGNGPVVTGVLTASGAGYGLGYLLATWYGPTLAPRARVLVVAAMVVLGLVPALVLGSPVHLTEMTFAISIGLMLLPLRWSVPLGLAVAAGQVGWMWLSWGVVAWPLVGALVGVTLGLGLVLALVSTIGHLQAARDQVRSLAVARERERVARDLHDVLGHSLSTMTVKTGLARRMLESSADTGQVIVELREIESLSRQALSDVRATVSDYRTVTLSTELAGAGVALRAAGIRADLPAAVDDVVPELRGVFGYVVREAVTNVIRHSGARTCRIRLDSDRVEISDDGDAGPGAPGNGLTGLTERLAAVSGTLRYGARPGGGFEIVARGPGSSVPEPSAPEPSTPAARPVPADQGGTP